MPPRIKPSAGLSSLIESDSEPDFDDLSRGADTACNAVQSKTSTKARGRLRTTANRITKPGQRGGRQTSRGSRATSRQALQEKSNVAPRALEVEAKVDKTSEEADTPDHEEDGMLPPSKRGRPRTRRNNAANAANPEGNASKAVHGRPSKTNPKVVVDIPETLPEPMEVEQEEELQGEGDIDHSFTSDMTHKEPFHEVDKDDMLIRKRLEEVTRRYETLEAKHKELREVGIKDAERNYERLKKQAEDNAAAANQLISELRAELATQPSVAKELELSEAKCDGLQTKVTELSTSLSDARSEIRSLSTRPAAARKAPGNSLKAATTGKGGAPVEVVQEAQAKEDLYGDLTGLIVRGMKRVENEDVFDCIQTGRNGTLHFKLALDTSDTCENFEDAQYTYQPQLDPNRDRDLMDVLPDYLQEEITFPRPHASKFYTRVIKSLTERLD